MGLFGKLFGYKSPIGSSERALLAEEETLSAEDQAKADALKLEEEKKRKALKARQKGMRGGGRTGLMFGGSQQGVM